MEENKKEIPLFCPKCGLDSVAGEKKCPFCGASYWNEPEETKEEENDPIFGGRASNDSEPVKEDYVPYYMRDPKETKTDEQVRETITVHDSKKGLIQKLLMLVIVLVVALTGLNAWNTYQNRNKNDKGTEFTVGSFENNVYTNEWAQLRINMRGNFKNAPSLFYSILNAAIQDPVEMHKAFTDNDELAVFIFSIRDDSYAFKKMKKLKANAVKEAFVESTIGDERTDIKIEEDVWLAGKKYYCFSQTIEQKYGGSINAYMCVRMIGNRMYFVVLFGKNFQDAMKYKQYFEELR